MLPSLESLSEALGGLESRRILVRADLNVPLDARGRITDDFRIEAALPTIGWLNGRGAEVVVCSHLGRPGGEPDSRYSLDSRYGPAQRQLNWAGGEPDSRCSLDSRYGPAQRQLNWAGGEPDSRYSLNPVRARLAELAPGVELLENLRFNPGETGNDDRFVQELVEGCHGYVNEAFGASHRAHASIVGPPRYLPSAAGRLLARETEVLLGLRAAPKRPFVAVLGGAKVSDKLGVIAALLEIADEVVIGGGMCFTFLAALGHPVGDSLLQTDQVEACSRLLASGARIRLPSDVTALAPGERVVQAGVDLRPGWRGLDIGPGSAAEFGDLIADAGTVLWNGPMGLFEDPRFAAGTKVVAQAMATTRAFTVVGGGDSAAAVRGFGLDREMDHVSTGGGASLELIERGDLPGLKALRKSQARRKGVADG